MTPDIGVGDIVEWRNFAKRNDTELKNSTYRGRLVGWASARRAVVECLEDETIRYRKPLIWRLRKVEAST